MCAHFCGQSVSDLWIVHRLLVHRRGCWVYACFIERAAVTAI